MAVNPRVPCRRLDAGRRLSLRVASRRGAGRRLNPRVACRRGKADRRLSPRVASRQQWSVGGCAKICA